MGKAGKWIGIIIVTCIAAIWAWQEWINKPAKGQARESVEKAQRATKTQHAKQRFNNWAYIAKEKEISPGETIKLVIIPSTYDDDFSDTKCFVYTHKEYRTSSMLCPDAKQDDIEETYEEEFE